MLVRYGSRCEVHSSQILNLPYRTAILGHDQFCFVLENARKLAKKILKTFCFLKNARFKEQRPFFKFLFGKRLNFLENLRIFRAKIFFFFGERLNFPKNLRNFGVKTFFIIIIIIFV